MTDPQTAADAAERCPVCGATAPYWRPDDRECEICLAIAEVPSALDELASDVEDGYSTDVIGEYVKHLRQKYALLVEHVGTLLIDRARMAAELEQVRRGVTLPVLRQAWRNGWSDRARAGCDTVRVSDNERDAYERAFARYASEDPVEADKDPYRPLDGPDDPATMPARPAGGLTGVGQGLTLPTPENGPQRGSQGDAAEPTP